MAKRVKDIMTPANKLVFLNSSATIEQAYNLMLSKGIRSILVMSGENFGPRIIEEDDLRFIWGQHVNTKKAKLEDYARPIEYRADPEWTCEELKHHFSYDSHLLVTDERGNILGMVTTTDLRKC